MPEHPWEQCARAFLEGHPATVRAVRGVAEAVAAGFEFPTAEARREVVQEALGRVVRAIRSGSYRGDASLTTFAHSVTNYTCVELVRRSQVDTIHLRLETLESPTSDPEASLIQAERHGRRIAALARLPAPARELLRLIFVEKLSHKEAGKRSGLTEAAVKARLHRYRRTLRDLAKHGEDD